jgi:hypothetical protein
MTKILSFFCLINTIALAQTNTFPSSGNVGIGTTSPAAKLSFNNLTDGSNQADGITWYNPDPLSYGIYRTAGPWVSPDYQQLRFNFNTGIILNPGASYGKSFVDIQGGGLRVTSGYLGIGTTSPSSKLVIDGIDNYTDGLTIQNTASYKHLITAFSDGNSPTAGSALQFKVANNNVGGNTAVMTLKGSGNVGIGTISPSTRLHLFNASSHTYLNIDKPGTSYEGGIQFSINGAPTFFLWSDNDGTDALRIQAVGLAGENDATPRMQFPKVNKNIYMVESGGNVGIGTTSPNQKLTVNGTIYGKEVKVDLNVPGPDYVFEKDYKLPSLEEIKSYVDLHKHLPEVPSAKEMEVNGINLSEMNMILLKKVEELTLHIIALKKENEIQTAKINELSAIGKTNENK